MARSDYTPPTFVDVPNPASPPNGAVPLDAARVNAMAQAIANSAAVGQSNVFTGTQQINGAVGFNASPTARQPFVSTQTVTASATGSTDKVGHEFNTIVTGNLGGSSGSNPAFAWGLSVFTTTGAASGDGAGGNLTNVIESDVATPAGTTVALAQGLVVQAAFYGSTAGATVTQMESLRVAAPARKDGATAGTATNVYGLFVEDVEAAAVGATGSTFSVFVAGGVSRFGGRVDVGGTIASLGSGLTLQGTLGAAAASLILNDVTSGGGHAQIKLGGSSSVFALTSSGGANIFLIDSTGALSLTLGTTTTAPTAGGAGALPATPTGYATVTINGAARKVAYY